MARKKLILSQRRKQLLVVRSVLSLVAFQPPVMKGNVLGLPGIAVLIGVIMAPASLGRVPAATVSARFAVAGMFWIIRWSPVLLGAGVVVAEAGRPGVRGSILPKPIVEITTHIITMGRVVALVVG